MLTRRLLLFAALMASLAAPQTSPGQMPTLNQPRGLVLTGLLAEWHDSAEPRDYKLVRNAVDDLLAGKAELTAADAPAVLTMYRVTLKDKYWEAAETLHASLMERLKSDTMLPPEEMYSAALFTAMYSATVHEDFSATAGIISPKPIPGQMHSMMLRADQPAWKMAALVDSLELMSTMTPQREAFLGELKRMAPISARSTSAIGPVAARVRTYALLKAVRLGYLPVSYQAAAKKAGAAMHGGAVDAAGQDFSEAGVAMLLTSEMDQAASATLAQNKVVAVDAWFNSQRRKDPRGNETLFHYKWDDDADSGFSFFGRAFKRYGAKLATVVDEPTYEHLKNASVYFIVSPDTPAKNPDPHYVNAKDVDAIVKWVNDGGVLVMMMNDSGNTEFEHTNTLSERFGIHFNPVLKNTVEGTHWEQAKVEIPATTGIFEQAHTAYMKEVCTISVQDPAKAVLRDKLHTDGEIFIATAKYGKGTVLAVVDPWLYNEYTDGKKLPAEYDHFAAAKDLARWTLSVAK